jgi:hypothetical protein
MFNERNAMRRLILSLSLAGLVNAAVVKTLI